MMSLHPVRRVGVITFVALASVMLLTVLQLPPASWLMAAEVPPTITTDRSDYPAGATVVLSGAGWQSGEAVQIVVSDSFGQTWQHSSTVIATADGTVTDSFSLPPYSVSTYDVVATGAISGVATTTFTDAPAQVELQQCRNGAAVSPNDCRDLGGSTGWVNGNVGASQAHMLEGYSTPFRAVMTNLPVNTAITLVIGYDIRESGANAFDFLTQYERFDPHGYFGHPAETVYPTDGVAGLSATTSTFPIPAPSSAGSPVAGQPTTAFNGLPADERVMTLFGGTIGAMAYVSQGSLTASQSSTQISVTFTTDNPTAVLAWGGHISECSVWGTTNGVCNSAGGISGSPYHMSLVSWGPALPNLGNTDRSMAAATVVQPGNLTLAKTLTGGPVDYTGPFTIAYDCGTGYSGSVSINSGTSQIVNGIPSGSVCTVSETPPTPPTGYSFGTPTFSPSDTVTIGAGTTVTVTTNNSLTRDTGSLVLAKTLTDGPAGYTGPFTIAYDCGNGYSGSVEVSAGGSQTVSGIPTGSTCTVSEPTLPAVPGYEFDAPTFSPSATATIPAGAGSTVTVTTNNALTRDPGSLTIAKSLSNPDDAPVPASFTINYNCGNGFNGSVQVAAGGSTTVPGIPTGLTCTVSEPALAPIPGYTWGTATVDPGSIVIADETSVFTLTVSNSITRDRGTLTIAKTLSNPDGASVPASFTIDYDCGVGYTGSVSVAAGGSQTVSGIPTGSTCTVSEPALAPIPGYTWGTATVDPASIVIADETSTFTVTVANSITRDTGSLRITKTVSGSAFTGSFDVSVTCTGDGGSYSRSIVYPAPGSVTIDGIPTGNTCTVTEPTQPAAPSGYIWGTPTIGGSPATITKGSVADVTVTNTLLTGHVQVTKTVGGASVSATNNCTDVSGLIVGCTFQLRQGASTTQGGTTLETRSTLVSGVPVGTLDFTTNLTPGQTYQLCEVIMPGWSTSLGAFVPGSFLPPDGVAPNPAVDNSILCGNFVAQADTTTVGNVFVIDDTPPPGGMGLTIGFWKNWSSCTGGNQLPILDETLAKALPGGVVVSATTGTYPTFGSTYYLTLRGSLLTPKVAPDCVKAVNILNKTTIDGKTKKASDPAFNLAAQLVAAELNYTAGAGRKPAVTSAINQAVLLLGKYRFNGLTHTTISRADVTVMNTLATLLDDYNNNRP